MSLSAVGADAVMVSVTGHEIREAVRRAEFRRLSYVNRFEESCVAFEGEKKDGPSKITEGLLEEDRRLAALRELQSSYNLAISVPTENGDVTLSYLVSSVRTAGALEGMWRKLVAKKRDRYDRLETQRTKDTEYARPTYSQDEAFKYATQTSEAASKIRSRIASANGVTTNLRVHKSLVALDDKGRLRLV